MRFSTITAAIAITASVVEGHGLITKITGANGVVMPGLSVIKDTRRDCQSNQCGSQRDTAIIKGADMDAGKATPLGRTQGGGPIVAAKMVANFMGMFENGTQIANFKTQVIDPTKEKDGAKKKTQKREAEPASLMEALARSASYIRKRNEGPEPISLKEALVRSAAYLIKRANAVPNKAATTDKSPASIMTGAGITSGMPTCSDTGLITATYHQINGDGAGPLTAKVDATSGGTVRTAFVEAKVVANVPGNAGNSNNVMTDFDISVQMPPGMICQGTVAGVTNLCILRVKNANPNGFGGAVAFQQPPKAIKRALEYQELKKRHFARGHVARNTIRQTLDD
ncbi:hypothetical protein H072_5820 [Dactylellina haptotyla CBS 200.50]|uniref:Cell surface protein n=1 Tax=Dactylellina haptotyla (strain CBS 200.50) TaxID=1284197 RepID=S8ABQ1_DACHA|nr:hypothetical protein H072_5820 [Dactylellina haptotyla CBS 200.50]